MCDFNADKLYAAILSLGSMEECESLFSDLFTKREIKDLSSRLEVARVAALAMKLSTATISSPFSDTSNGSVLALYQAGIIEGSFNTSGLRYYYPSNSIQRAEISAIIWRINNYS